MEHAFIFAAGWIFFAVWGMTLAALSVIAFGRDISSSAHHRFSEPEKDRT
jgi:hypothetical protein